MMQRINIDMKYDEFIEYIDEIIDYEKIAGEYKLSYSEIKFAIDYMKDKMANAKLVISKQDVEADAGFECTNCGGEITGIGHRCLQCGR